MDKKSITPDSGGDQPMAEQDNSSYAERPYERRLTNSGRRFISVDIDTNLLDRIDRDRGKLRRGAYLDKLIAQAFAGEGDPRMSR